MKLEMGYFGTCTVDTIREGSEEVIALLEKAVKCRAGAALR